MPCCILAAWVLGLVLSAWRQLTGTTHPPSAPAPPVVSRPAPGLRPGTARGENTRPAGSSVRQREIEPPPRVAGAGSASRRAATHRTKPPRLATAWLLRFAAFAVEAYILGVLALLALGAADPLADPSLGWTARYVLFGLFAFGALIVAEAIAPLSARPAVWRELGAHALIGVGAVWLTLGFIDQHVFFLFHIADGSLVWDAVFHGAGSGAMLAGWIVLVRTHPSRPVNAATE